MCNLHYSLTPMALRSRRQLTVVPKLDRELIGGFRLSWAKGLRVRKEVSLACHLRTRPFMRRYVFLLTVGAAGLLTLHLSAQTATEVIASSRRMDWSTAGAGPIPSRDTQCGATIQPYSGSASSINSALQNCPAGQHVQLGAGTFTISTGIAFDGKANVTLRGAGPDRTFLKFTGYDPCEGAEATICISPPYMNWTGGPQNTASWTGGYAVGTRVITLSSVQNLAVNSLMILDQLNDSNTDNGEYWVCGSGGVGACASSGASGVGRTNRQQMFITRVVAINGNNVTIADPLVQPNWRASQSPGAWWAGSGAPVPVIMGVGIEDLSVDSTGASGASFGIYFGNANSSWVKNVRHIALPPSGLRAHIRFYQSAHITVRDSYTYGKVGSTANYGIESYMASNNLVENNIGECMTGFTVTDTTVGSVYAYNYTINNCYINQNWMQPSASFHSPGNAFNLLEGNDGAGLQLDEIHGTADFITAFRNRFRGWEPGKGLQTVAVHNYAFSRFQNIVGNVLGTAGYHLNYERAAGSTTSSGCHQSIYALGWGGNCGNDGIIPDDPRVKYTMLRWGNYDTVTRTTQFQAAEVPSGLTKYSNPVPSTQALPASLYLPARPRWWPASSPWPAIGPDVTGGNEPNIDGHAYSIPARVCYQNTPVDTAYARSSTITGASWSSGRATVTVGSHTAQVGGTIQVSGVNPAGYNGAYLVYATTTTTVSYGMLTSPGAYASGGVMQTPPVKLFNASNCYTDGPPPPRPPTNVRIIR